MLHIYVKWLYTYVASFCSQCFTVFSDVCCKCVYLDVAYVSSVLSGCCVCVAMLFQLFHVFLSVSDACFKRFISFQTYVASVVSDCFKSRSDVASLSSPSAASPWCLLGVSSSSATRQVMLRFTFYVMRGCLDGMLLLVGHGSVAWDWELRADALLAPNVRTPVPPF